MTQYKGVKMNQLKTNNSNKQVNLLKNTLLTEFEDNIKNGLYALTQKMMAYNSNRIEGSTLTSEHTASLFDTGTLVSDGVMVYKAKDIEEATGHFKMFNEMLKNIDKPLTIELIKKFHFQLKSGVFEDYANGYVAGEFKKWANIVSDIKTVSPNSVNNEMNKLLDNYNNNAKDIETIAKFHARFETIHPFQDGNGRVGRMILFKQCLDNNITPIVIKEIDKPIYINALHKAQTDENFIDLINIFKVSQAQYFDEIKDFIKTNDEQSTDDIEL